MYSSLSPCSWPIPSARSLSPHFPRAQPPNAKPHLLFYQCSFQQNLPHGEAACSCPVQPPCARAPGKELRWRSPAPAAFPSFTVNTIKTHKPISKSHAKLTLLFCPSCLVLLMPFPVALSAVLQGENNTELTLNTGVGVKNSFTKMRITKG